MISKSNSIESFLLGVGLSVAFMILLNISDGGGHATMKSSSFEVSATPIAPQNASNDEELVSLDVSGYIPAVVQVEAAREFLCIFSILFLHEIFIPDYKPDVPLPLAKFLFTLFRTVISPNAP
jgi:hypothetical protein